MTFRVFKANTSWLNWQKTDNIAINWLIRPGLLEAWLVLTSVKYHGNLYILIPLNQRLALTRLRATGPRSIKESLISSTDLTQLMHFNSEDDYRTGCRNHSPCQQQSYKRSFGYVSTGDIQRLRKTPTKNCEKEGENRGNLGRNLVSPKTEC